MLAMEYVSSIKTNLAVPFISDILKSADIEPTLPEENMYELLKRSAGGDKSSTENLKNLVKTGVKFSINKQKIPKCKDMVKAQVGSMTKHISKPSVGAFSKKNLDANDLIDIFI
jgi:cation transport regulator ChaC